MNSAQVRLIIEALRLAKEFGMDYVEKKVKATDRTEITEKDLDTIVRYDPDPGDVFDND